MYLHHTRKIGFFELYYLGRNQLKCYTNYCIIAKYNHALNQSILSPALRQVVLANPYLAANFFPASSVASFDNYDLRAVDQIRFEDVVEYKTVSQIDESLLEEINTYTCKMDETERPLWRVIVYTTPESDETPHVCFYCDHTLFDGTSGTSFHKKLIRELGNVGELGPTSGDILFNYEADKDLLPKFPQSSDKYVNNKPPAIFVAKFLFRVLSPQWLRRTFIYLWNRTPVIGGSARDRLLEKYPIFRGLPANTSTATRFKIINLPPSDSAGVLKYCKEKHLTFTPLLYTVGIKTLQDTILLASMPFATEAIISVTTRRYLAKEQMGQHDFGLFVGPQPLINPPISQISVPEIIRVQEDIAAGLEARTPLYTVGMLKYVDVKDFLNGILGKLKETFEISNLGLQNVVSADGRWEIQDMLFSQCFGRTSPYFCLSVVSTKSGGLNLVLGMAPEYCDANPELVDQFASELTKNIMARY
ncbi:hypothetical protein BABINDRAFT_162332 [Babjeviella inositovora NRRL Y-12698]|uniref:Alcohol acetyltransferase n=1 Tax=Babjeviella inositovora NRRL Y-12698 TaxID=984486 RepID=A0A1E3QLT8_9ASCO|nr:uncharacterized protein BABINDRAFT_162332 [Babjeviella inositovora NRRL Y-12698]ODQ78620.1 hypothetical protein BABINDRAFT_162332 [Babjeviella inositovora NRRL Y-12698]